MPDTGEQSTSTVAVWGAGAIGGTMAAYFARAGMDVVVVDLHEEHVEACRTTGLRIQGTVDEFTQQIDAYTPSTLVGTFDRIILSVKAQHTETAMRQIMQHLTSNGVVLSAQNGLNERIIAQWVGQHRTMGCFVNFGAHWAGPGDIVYGGRGEVVIGELDGTVLPRTLEMRDLLATFEASASVTDNIWGYLWGKLAFAALLATTSVTHEGMDAGFADAKRFPIYYALAREVYRVAESQGVVPMKVAGLDPDAFYPNGSEDTAWACIEALSRRRRGSATHHSGFYRDLAVRKRQTEVDALLGPVVAEASRAGIETRVLNRLIRIIHEIECDLRSISPRNIEDLLLEVE